MGKTLFDGTGVALATPFTKEEVDWNALDRLTDAMTAAGIEGIVALGTTGEASFLDETERRRVAERVIERAAGRARVIVGIGTNDTRETARRATVARDMGADGVLAVTPYYVKPSQSGLIAHYFAVADACEIPVIVYDVPSRTGVSIESETLLRLAAHPGIAGVKAAYADASRLADAAKICAEARLRLYAGNDDMTLTTLALGGCGVISVAANVAPRHTRAVTEAWHRGDHRAALRAQTDILPLVRRLFSEANPVPVKAALAALGCGDGSVRKPLTPLSDENRAALLAEMRALGLF